MRTLNKIVSLALISLASLTGCTKTLNSDGKVVKYNNYHAKTMIVQGNNEITDYYAPLRLPHPTSKDVLMFDVWKGNEGRLYSHPYNKKDSSIVKEKLKEFDYYMDKFDSIDNLK